MRIADFLGASRTNVTPSIMGFPSIDIEGTAKRLEIKKRAVERGARNLPGLEDESLDLVEQLIVSEMENEAKVQYDSYLNSQKTYADRISNAGVEGLVVEIASVADSAITNFERLTRVGTGDLIGLRRDVVDSDRDLKTFRETHRLGGPARNQHGKVLKIGVLVFILSLEMALNGYFFQMGDTLGYLGGALQALIIAAMNVFFGFVIGRFVAPWMRWRNNAVRTLAGTGVIIYIVLAIAFNLGVAHYRTAYGIDAELAPTAGFTSFTADPFGITDIQSWALFLMGLAFSFVAAFDGFLWDDPYPGYGARTRQNRAALEAYNFKKSALLDELADIKAEVEERLEDIGRSVQNRRGEYGQVAVKSDALRAAITDHFTHIESAANTLLRMYRDENAASRADKSVPKQFDTRWTYRAPAVEGRVYTDPAALDEAVQRALTEIPRKLDALHAAYRTANSEYARIDELIEVGDAK